MSKLELPTRPAAPAVEPADLALEAEKRIVVIRPAPRWPHLDVRELWHYRELLLSLVWRDVRVRYKQTFLGVVWALLVPAFTATVYVIVFGKFVPMQYFASSLTASSMSLLTNLPLVTKVYFPRVLLPLGAVLVPLFDLLVALPVLIALMAFYGTWPHGIAIVAAPAFIFMGLVTALGIGFLLSAVNVRYRDVPYMIPVFLQVLPLVSGVMYAVSQIPAKWQWVISVNPMTTVISGWRWAILGEVPPNWGQAAVGATMTILLFTVGLTVFRATEPRFADTI